MNRINAWIFFALGDDIGKLATVRGGIPLAGIIVPLERAATALDFMVNPPEPPLFTPALCTARQPAAELLEFVRYLLQCAHKSAGSKVTLDLVRQGDAVLGRFETAMQFELSALHTYSVSQTLGWDTDILVERAEEILPAAVRVKVPDEAISDLKAAGRCLAFDLYTAAGFHTVRATESVIKKYYTHVVGSPPGVKSRNWGAYIRTLQKHGADPRVTGFLDHIREHYRNPVAHPEESLDNKSAQVLLSVCTSSIIQMAQQF